MNTDALVDMVVEFCNFIQYCNEAAPYVYACCFSIIIAANFGLLMISMKLKDDRIKEKYKDDPKPELIMSYAYSKSGELCVYENGCRISRANAFVSGLMCKVIDVSSINKDSNNRIISVTYKDDKKNIKTEEIHCGDMPIFEFMRLKDFMLQYAGG